MGAMQCNAMQCKHITAQFFYNINIFLLIVKILLWLLQYEQKKFKV